MLGPGAFLCVRPVGFLHVRPRGRQFYMLGPGAFLHVRPTAIFMC